MNYIIDPSVLYWINALGTIKIIVDLLSGLFSFATFCLLSLWIFYKYQVFVYDSESDKEWAAVFKRLTIIVGTISLLCLAGSILIPDKKTSIEMLIAKTATFDNVNWTFQQVKDMVDYIVTAVRGV